MRACSWVAAMRPWLLASCLSSGLSSYAPALAQEEAASSISRFDVPPECSTPEVFLARLGTLGAEVGEAQISVEVVTSWAGNPRGTVIITRPGARPAERTIEDTTCADIVDALAISASLVLRSAPEPIAVGDPGQGPTSDRIGPAPTEPVIAPLVSPTVHLSVGAGLRIGLGPVPGVTAAPEIFGRVEVQRFLVGLRLVFFPEAAAPGTTGMPLPMGGPTPGVAVYGIDATLELGARLGDEISVVPTAVLELGPTIGRGVFVEQARTAPAFTCDAGVAVSLELVYQQVHLFLRGDLLFGIAQPVYVVADGPVFEAPVVRGTGGIGLAYRWGI